MVHSPAPPAGAGGWGVWGGEGLWCGPWPPFCGGGLLCVVCALPALGGGSLTQLLVEGNCIEIAQAVVMDRADQALLKIHVVFDATTVVRVLPHT